ncbi:unnamed protein product, partial [Pylaiella littoralis]
ARGYSWSTGICKQAAGDRHLVLLKWCLLNGCPWSWSEVVDAARGGDFADGSSLDVRIGRSGPTKLEEGKHLWMESGCPW